MTIRETNLSIVVEVDADGKIVDSLQGDSGRIVLVSETQKIGENLFFGSPYNKYLGRLELNPPTMEVEGKGVRMKTGHTDEEKEDKEKTRNESPDEVPEEKESDEKTMPDTKEEL